MREVGSYRIYTQNSDPPGAARSSSLVSSSKETPSAADASLDMAEARPMNMFGVVARCLVQSPEGEDGSSLAVHHGYGPVLPFSGVYGP